MSLFTMQNAFKPKFCQIMERDFFRCLSRVGVQNTDRLCKIYWEDLLECQDHEKAVCDDGKGSQNEENGANDEHSVQHSTGCGLSLTCDFSCFIGV
ncbi:unnamed protein product [Heterobilharzia americana]|nr:unnamed protein product [Heterobilharzia americana]